MPAITFMRWNPTTTYLELSSDSGGTWFPMDAKLSTLAVNSTVRFYDSALADYAYIQNPGSSSGTQGMSFTVNGSNGYLFKTYNSGVVNALSIAPAGDVAVFGAISAGKDLTTGTKLVIQGSSSGAVGFTVPSAAGSVTYVLPNTDGVNDDVLTTDGAGNLHWSTKTGGGGVSVSSINGDSSAAQTIAAGTGLSIVNSGATHTLSVASVPAGSITGSHTLPDGVLSTNVPLLNLSNIFSAAVTGDNSLTVTNTSSGVANIADVQVFAGTSNLVLRSFSQGFTTSAYAVANGSAVIGATSGGLSVVAIDAAGIIRFYSGGVTERGRIHASGGLSWGNTTDPGNHNVSITGDLLVGGSFAPANVSLGTIVPGSNKAPLTVWVEPTATLAGTAVGLWIEQGNTPSNTATNPGAGDAVAFYSYQVPEASGQTWTEIWAMNSVVHSKNRDVGLCGVEIDVQNETATCSTVPFQTQSGPLYSKHGIASVVGGSGYDSTVAFACTVNFNPAMGDHRWLYGYWSSGVRTAAFHVDFITNQNGNMHPSIAYDNVSNAATLIKSTGAHSSAIIDVANYYSVSGHGNTIINTPDDGLINLWYTGANNPMTAIGLYKTISSVLTLCGSITLDNGPAAHYNSVSDRRIKQNFRPISSALDRINQLNPCTFEFKVTPGKDYEGFIADEVEQVVKNAVTGIKDGAELQQLDMSKMIPLIVASIQELYGQRKQEN